MKPRPGDIYELRKSNTPVRAALAGLDSWPQTVIVDVVLSGLGTTVCTVGGPRTGKRLQVPIEILRNLYQWTGSDGDSCG